MNIKVYTQKDINKAFEQGKKAAIRLCMNDIMAAVSIALIDKHGWKSDEITRLNSEVDNTFTAVLEGRVTLDEVIEAKNIEVSSK